MRDDTAYRLAAIHPQSANIHWEIKMLIPELDGLKLLLKGFSDCSWGNDEVPSYYIDGCDDMQILACDDIDGNGERISDIISYYILADCRECPYQYATIDEAIAAYLKLSASIKESQS